MSDSLWDRSAPVDPAVEAMEAPRASRGTLVPRLMQRLTGLTPDSVRLNLHRGFKLLRDALGGTS